MWLISDSVLILGHLLSTHLCELGKRQLELGFLHINFYLRPRKCVCNECSGLWAVLEWTHLQVDNCIKKKKGIGNPNPTQHIQPALSVTLLLQDKSHVLRNTLLLLYCLLCLFVCLCFYRVEVCGVILSFFPRWLCALFPYKWSGRFSIFATKSRQISVLALLRMLCVGSSSRGNPSRERTPEALAEKISKSDHLYSKQTISLCSMKKTIRILRWL